MTANAQQQCAGCDECPFHDAQLPATALQWRGQKRAKLHAWRIPRSSQPKCLLSTSTGHGSLSIAATTFVTNRGDASSTAPRTFPAPCTPASRVTSPEPPLAHEQLGRGMVELVGVHRADDAQLVG